MICEYIERHMYVNGQSCMHTRESACFPYLLFLNNNLFYLEPFWNIGTQKLEITCLKL